ncbi:MAG: hypothetical protein WCD89_15420 [Anaerocolumna sp.]
MITIYDWFGYELTIKERYQLIKEAGFDFIPSVYKSEKTGGIKI